MIKDLLQRMLSIFQKQQKPVISGTGFVSGPSFIASGDGRYKDGSSGTGGVNQPVARHVAFAGTLSPTEERAIRRVLATLPKE